MAAPDGGPDADPTRTDKRAEPATSAMTRGGSAAAPSSAVRRGTTRRVRRAPPRRQGRNRRLLGPRRALGASAETPAPWRSGFSSSTTTRGSPRWSATISAPPGFVVDRSLTGRDGLAALERTAFDAVILDVMLPDIDGFELCRTIRARAATPILMLTARGDETDRIVGLELGADDYLPKPFSPRELLARLRAILRRGPLSRPGGVGTLRFGRLSIDRESRMRQRRRRGEDAHELPVRPPRRARRERRAGAQPRTADGPRQGRGPRRLRPQHRRPRLAHCAR